MNLGRYGGITRRGKFLILGLGRFACIVGWGTWGEFQRAFRIEVDVKAIDDP